MKKNYSMPKMGTVHKHKRLNQLESRSRSRLEFPTHIQSKKHYFDYPDKKVMLGSYIKQGLLQNNNKRSNLDINDIDGARPRVIQKEKNVMNYYRNKNQQYNPFSLMQKRTQASASENKLKSLSQRRNQPIRDSLDIFKQKIQQKLLLNPQNQRKNTEHSINNCLSDKISKKHILQSINRLFTNHETDNKPLTRSKVYNPTFLSNILLL